MHWYSFYLSVAIVRVSNLDTNQAEAKQIQPEEKKVNYAVSEGAQSFAQNFARDYFDWQNSDEGIKTRAERLQPYFATGLDKQAGLSFEGMEWNSSLSDSQVWNIEDTGKRYRAYYSTCRTHIENKTTSTRFK